MSSSSIFKIVNEIRTSVEARAMDENDSQVASFERPRLFIVELRALVVDGSVWHAKICEVIEWSLSDAHRALHIIKVAPRALPEWSQAVNRDVKRRSRTLLDIMAQ